jgi:hypothetical protein
MKLRSFGTALVVAVAAASLSCGGGGSVTPQPTPTLAPTTAADICTTLGKGDRGASCAVSRTPQLGARVDAAIDALIAQQPGLFDLTHVATRDTRQYLVLDRKAYFKGVVANLKAASLCAEADLFDDHRIKVKSDLSYSEDYNIVDLSGYIRRSDARDDAASYDLSCTPSAFPLDTNPDVPPPDQKCGVPYPPQITHFGVRIFLRALDKWTLDSTPQIDDAAYCAALGYTDGRSRCPLRPEGNPERVPCEGWRVGIAKDTGRLGPTWTRDGKLCTGPASGCDNSPDNQFQLWVYEGDGKDHTYKVCTENATGDAGCGEITFDH